MTDRFKAFLAALLFSAALLAMPAIAANSDKNSPSKSSAPAAETDAALDGTESPIWTNPRNGKVLTLPQGWLAFSEGQGEDDNVLFSNYSRELIVNYSVAGAANTTIEEIVAVTPGMFAEVKWDAPFAPANAADRQGFWLASGVYDGGSRTSVHLKIVGDKFGMAIYIDMAAGSRSSTAVLDDPALTAMLFESDTGGAENAVDAPDWVNPRSGASVPLPEGWRYKGIVEQTNHMFINAAENRSLVYSFLPNPSGMSAAEAAAAMPDIYKDISFDGPFQLAETAGLGAVWQGAGSAGDGTRLSVYLKPFGSGFGMQVYADIDTPEIKIITSPLTAALFDSEKAP